jgi:hypothetical protein
LFTSHSTCLIHNNVWICRIVGVLTREEIPATAGFVLDGGPRVLTIAVLDVARCHVPLTGQCPHLDQPKVAEFVPRMFLSDHCIAVGRRTSIFMKVVTVRRAATISYQWGRRLPICRAEHRELATYAINRLRSGAGSTLLDTPKG